MDWGPGLNKKKEEVSWVPASISASWLWVPHEQPSYSGFLKSVGAMWAAISFWLPDCGCHVSGHLILASWLWIPHEQLPHAPNTLTSMLWWTPCSQKQIFLPVTCFCEVFGFSNNNGNWYRVGNLARDIRDVLFSFLLLWWNLKGGILWVYSALYIYITIFHWKELRRDSVQEPECRNHERRLTHCLLAHSLAHARLAFLCNPSGCHRDDAIHSGLGPLTSMNNQGNVPQTWFRGQSVLGNASVEAALSDDSRLYRVDNYSSLEHGNSYF